MSKFKCCECDAIFEEDEADSRREYVGEFWGVPAYEDLMACPNCGSTDMEEYYEEIEEIEEEEDPEE